jgi:hypothetical protein
MRACGARAPRATVAGTEHSSLSVREAFEGERTRLMALPQREYALGDSAAVEVGKTSCVRFDLNNDTVQVGPGRVGKTMCACNLGYQLGRGLSQCRVRLLARGSAHAPRRDRAPGGSVLARQGGAGTAGRAREAAPGQEQQGQGLIPSRPLAGIRRRPTLAERGGLRLFWRIMCWHGGCRVGRNIASDFCPGVLMLDHASHMRGQHDGLAQHQTSPMSTNTTDSPPPDVGARARSGDSVRFRGQAAMLAGANADVSHAFGLGSQINLGPVNVAAETLSFELGLYGLSASIERPADVPEPEWLDRLSVATVNLMINSPMPAALGLDDAGTAVLTLLPDRPLHVPRELADAIETTVTLATSLL